MEATRVGCADLSPMAIGSEIVADGAMDCGEARPKVVEKIRNGPGYLVAMAVGVRSMLYEQISDGSAWAPRSLIRTQRAPSRRMSDVGTNLECCVPMSVTVEVELGHTSNVPMAGGMLSPSAGDRSAK